MFMKHFAAALLLILGLTLLGCGSSNSNSGNINGTWDATLTDSNNVQAFTFGVSIVQSGNGSLSLSNFTFNSNPPCFVSDETATGTFTLSGNFSGSVKGSFGFIVNSGQPAGNTLTLNGTANGNTISGTWTMTGTGCSGTGTFTMTKS
jgi:hypothetical protein